MDSSAFHGAHKYCHNGGMAFASNYSDGHQIAERVARNRGSMNGIMAPFADP